MTAAGLQAVTLRRAEGTAWAFSLDVSGWDRRSGLTVGEAAALAEIGPAGLRRSRARGTRAFPLVAGSDPAGRAGRSGGGSSSSRPQRCPPAGRRARDRRSSCSTARTPGRRTGPGQAGTGPRLAGSGSREFLDSQALPTEKAVRPFLVALAYLLAGFTDFQHLGMFNRLHLAQLVFGTEAVDAATGEATAVLGPLGLPQPGPRRPSTSCRGVLGQALLINRSPRLADLTTEAFTRLHAHPASRRPPAPDDALRAAARGRLARLLRSAGAPRLQPRARHRGNRSRVGRLGRAVARHLAADPEVRAIIRTIVAKAGRWLAAEHPRSPSPGSGPGRPARPGSPPSTGWRSATTSSAATTCTAAPGNRSPRAPRPTCSWPPGCSSATARNGSGSPAGSTPPGRWPLPRSVGALIGTDPRVIADDVWAKLLWAGLNIEAADLPGTSAGSYYPMELIRALTLTWLFSGLRSDEISRLRVGCIRWQHDGQPIPGDSRESSPTTPSACWTCRSTRPAPRSPSPSTRSSARPSKPGRPCGPPSPRGWTARPASTSTCCSPSAPTRSPRTYINRTIIPALCAKAGVPTADVRGNITSHRARSTIASQLYNAKEPMTLFELQAWLGHQNPASTQHYAKITPNTLTKAYTEAGYFARNVRTIEVLLDRDAVTSGAAADGQPWQYYDLGHGLLLLHLLRAVPAPDGLRAMRLLHPEELQQGPAAGSQGQPAAHARRHPAHRRRTRRRRRRAGRTGLPPRPARRHPHPRRRHTPPARRLTSADPPADHRGPPRQTRMKPDI